MCTIALSGTLIASGSCNVPIRIFTASPGTSLWPGFGTMDSTTAVRLVWFMSGEIDVTRPFTTSAGFLSNRAVIGVAELDLRDVLVRHVRLQPDLVDLDDVQDRACRG